MQNFVSTTPLLDDFTDDDSSIRDTDPAPLIPTSASRPRRRGRRSRQKAKQRWLATQMISLRSSPLCPCCAALRAHLNTSLATCSLSPSATVQPLNDDQRPPGSPKPTAVVAPISIFQPLRPPLGRGRLLLQFLYRYPPLTRPTVSPLPVTRSTFGRIRMIYSPPPATPLCNNIPVSTQ